MTWPRKSLVDEPESIGVDDIGLAILRDFADPPAASLYHAVIPE
jgi:hypothetical protein